MKKRGGKVYRPCPIKRARRTKAEIDDIKDALKRIVEAGTIRRALCRDGQGRASGPLGAALDRIADRR